MWDKIGLRNFKIIHNEPEPTLQISHPAQDINKFAAVPPSNSFHTRVPDINSEKLARTVLWSSKLLKYIGQNLLHTDVNLRSITIRKHLQGGEYQETYTKLSWSSSLELKQMVSGATPPPSFPSFCT